jgi:hypothetical protein
MPPVLDVSFDELSRRGTQEMIPTKIRLRVQERKHILQLISKAERAPWLVWAAPRPDAAAQVLIQQPSVHNQVE